ncbi:hypothetical protein P691DRAFT_801484 [Macrolepiota fuliginosa MF-IS2]|uniref:Uncharacterized protein n=1 Tax=Macrolepiota fuliginosa MF-IS2 TaxID=1400762 RepID=A0A9P5XEB2_9AGAR|nr:hypothetical protein P691DRAFT_801484 [Macrolepiota fuliginosa MF-IS2]
MAIPISLWIASLVSGIINCTTDNSLPAAILFTSNMLTSIYGTCFITIRLWLYRRMVRHCFGDKVQMGRYNDIMGMLLKSAAIYVPIAICVSAESMPTANVTPGLAIVCSIFAPCQGLASILIIYQVALGRATGQRNQEEATLVTEKGSHGAVVEDTQIRLLAA